MPETKTITLRFNIPSTMDTPSEVLARMRELLLSALEESVGRDTRFSLGLSDEERSLCTALLTES